MSQENIESTFASVERNSMSHSIASELPFVVQTEDASMKRLNEERHELTPSYASNIHPPDNSSIASGSQFRPISISENMKVDARVVGRDWTATPLGSACQSPQDEILPIVLGGYSVDEKKVNISGDVKGSPAVQTLSSEDERDPLRDVIRFTLQSHEEQEFMISKNYDVVKRLEYQVADIAKRYAHMNVELGSMKKLVRKHQNSESKNKHSSSNEPDRETILKTFSEIKMKSKELSRGDTFCLQYCSRILYILYKDARYLGYLMKILRYKDDTHHKDNKVIIMKLITQYMYEEHWSSFKDKSFLSLIEYTLHDEADNCIDFPNSYLRGECVPIKLITKYLKQEDSRKVLVDTLGESYILGIVGQQDLTMNAHSVATELGLKLGRAISSSSPEVVEELKKRIEPLVRVCDNFLSRIMKSTLTPGMRWICRTLGDVARKKCPGDPKVVDFLIGGFVFLRFFNPYILENSKDTSKRVRDSLIMVTKVLQNISNHVLYKEDKKKHRHLLNPYIEKKFAAIHEYFRTLTQPPKERPNIDEAMGRGPSCYARFKTSSLSYLYQLLLIYQKNLETGLKLDKKEDPLITTLDAMTVPARKYKETVHHRIMKWRNVGKWTTFKVINGIHLDDVGRSSMKESVSPRKAKSIVARDRKSKIMADEQESRMPWQIFEDKALLSYELTNTGFLGTAQDLQEVKDLLLCGGPSGTLYFMWFRDTNVEDEKGSKVFAWSEREFCTIGSPDPNTWLHVKGTVSGKMQKLEKKYDSTEALKTALIPAVRMLVRHQEVDKQVGTFLKDMVKKEEKALTLDEFCSKVNGLYPYITATIRGEFQHVKLQADIIRKREHKGLIDKIILKIQREMKLRASLSSDLETSRRALEVAFKGYQKKLASTNAEFASLEANFRKKVGETKRIQYPMNKEKGEVVDGSLHVTIEEIIGGLLHKFINDVAKELQWSISFAKRKGLKADHLLETLFTNTFNPQLDESEWRGKLAMVFPRCIGKYEDTMIKFATLCDRCVNVAVEQAINTLPQFDDLDVDEKDGSEDPSNQRFSWRRFYTYVYSLIPDLKDKQGQVSKVNKEILDMIVDIMATDVLMAALQHFSPDADSKERQLQSTYKILLRRALPRFALPGDYKISPRVAEVRNYVASRWALVLGSICPYAASDLCSLIRLAILPIYKHQKNKNITPISISDWLRHSKFTIAVSAIKSTDACVELKLPQPLSALGITKMATVDEMIFFLYIIRYLRFDHKNSVCMVRAQRLFDMLKEFIRSPLVLHTRIRQEQQTHFKRELIRSMEHMLRGIYFAKGLDMNPAVIQPLYAELVSQRMLKSELFLHAKQLAATILLRSNEEFYKANINYLLSNLLLKGILRNNRVKAQHLCVLLHFLRGSEGERYYGMPWIRFEGGKPLQKGYQRFGHLYHKLAKRYLTTIYNKLTYKKVFEVPELTSISERIIVQMACHDPDVVQGMLLGDGLLDWGPTRRNWGRTFQNRHLLALRCLECLVMKDSGFQEYMISLSSSQRESQALSQKFRTLFIKDQKISEVFVSLAHRAHQAVGLVTGIPEGSQIGKDGYPNITFDRLSEPILSVLDRLPEKSMWRSDRTKRGVSHFVYFYCLRLLPKILPPIFFEPSSENCIGDEKANDPPMFPGRLIVHDDPMLSETASKSLHKIMRESRPPIQTFIIQCFIMMLHDPKMSTPSCICKILREMESLIKEWTNHLSTLSRRSNDGKFKASGGGGGSTSRGGRNTVSQRRQTRPHRKSMSHNSFQGGKGGGILSDGGESVFDCKKLHEKFDTIRWHCEADALALVFANHMDPAVRDYALRLMSTIQDLIACKLSDTTVHPSSILCVQDVWALHSSDIIDSAVLQLGTRVGRAINKRISLANDNLSAVCQHYKDDWFYHNVMCALARQTVDCQLSKTAHFALTYICRTKCQYPQDAWIKNEELFQLYYGMIFALSAAPIICPTNSTEQKEDWTVVTHSAGIMSNKSEKPRMLKSSQSLLSMTESVAEGKSSTYKRMKLTITQLWDVVFDKHDKLSDPDLRCAAAASASIECHPVSQFMMLDSMLSKYHSLTDTKRSKFQGKKALPLLARILKTLTASETHRRAIASRGEELVHKYLTFIYTTKQQLWNKNKYEKSKWFKTQISLIEMVKCLCESIAATFSGGYLLSRISETGMLPGNPNSYTKLFDRMLPLSPPSTVESENHQRPITRSEIFQWLTDHAHSADKILHELKSKGSDPKTNADEERQHKLMIKSVCLGALRQLTSLGKCVDKLSIGSCVQRNHYFLPMTDELLTKAWDDMDEPVRYSFGQLTLLHPGQRVELDLSSTEQDKRAQHNILNCTYRLELKHTNDTDYQEQQVLWYQSLNSLERPAKFTAPKKPGIYVLSFEMIHNGKVLLPTRSLFRVEMPSAHILPALLLFFHPKQLLAQFLAEAIGGESEKAKLCVKAILQVFTTDTKPLSILPASLEISRMIGPERFSSWSRSMEFRDVTEVNLDKLLFMALYHLGCNDRNTRFLTFQMLTCIALDWDLLSLQEHSMLKRYSFAFESGIQTSARSYAIKISKLLAKSVPGFALKLITYSFTALKKLRDPEWILTFLLPWVSHIDLCPPKPLLINSETFHSPTHIKDRKSHVGSTLRKRHISKESGSISASKPQLVTLTGSGSQISTKPAIIPMSFGHPRGEDRGSQGTVISDEKITDFKKDEKEPRPTSSQGNSRKKKRRIKQQGQTKLLIDLMEFIRDGRLRERMVDFLVELGRTEDNIVTIVSFMLGKIPDVVGQRDDKNYSTQIGLNKSSDVIQSSIFAIYSRVSKNRGFILELFFQCMRKYLTGDSSQTITNRGIEMPTTNIGQLQRTHIRFSLYDMLNQELKSLEQQLTRKSSLGTAEIEDYVARIAQEQERVISAMLVEFIGIDREVVRPWLPEMVVYAIIALARKNQTSSTLRDVMCSLLVRLISAFETSQGAVKTQRATDELEHLVSSFEVKENAEHSKRQITSHLLKIFRVECPICVPQIGRAAFKWGVLSQDLSITKMAFLVYECLLEPLEDTKAMSKASMKGSILRASTSRKRSTAQSQGMMHTPRSEFSETELVGMDSRVGIHTLLVRLVQILQTCQDYSHFLEHRLPNVTQHAVAILDILLVLTQHLASIDRLHRHPALLWAAAALLRCDIPQIYSFGIDILQHLRYYTFLKDREHIPQNFWSYAEGWHPRFTGILTSLIPGMITSSTEAKALEVAYRLIRIPSNTLVGMDPGSSIRQIISIMMFLPWLHISLSTDKFNTVSSTSNSSIPASIQSSTLLPPLETKNRTSLTPSKVLTALSTLVARSQKELSELLHSFAKYEAKSNEIKADDLGEVFLKRVCSAIVQAYFPKYALPCARYLAALCKGDCIQYHRTAFAAVNYMITQQNSQEYIMAFQPIIKIAQNFVVEGGSNSSDKVGPDSSSAASAQIMRAVMAVLLETKRGQKSKTKYLIFDALPQRSIEHTLLALKPVLNATPSF